MESVRSVDRKIRLDTERSARVRRVPNTDARIQSEHASYCSRVPETSMAANQKVIAFFFYRFISNPLYSHPGPTAQIAIVNQECDRKPKIAASVSKCYFCTES